jgi:3-oxoacyl-[acyl-carrier protein] reductase
MSNNLQRRALVTGGSGDLGGAICRRLAADGMDVIVHANGHLDRAEAVRDAIVASGGSAQAVAFDVADGDATRAALGALLEQGPIQIVVNNAGIHDDAPMAGMREEQWKRVIDVSLHGFFHVTQPLLLPMARTRWGRIVSISSVAAVLGNRGQTNYAAAKAALHGATRSLAREMASRGITVNVVAPGVIAGSMAQDAFPPEQIKQTVPAGRAGTPEEVAALVAFLCGADAGYINGQVIGVNGGMG